MTPTCPDALKGAHLLITGGAGFLATNLIEAVIQDCTVTVLDTFRRNALCYSPVMGSRNLTTVTGDVRDADLVERLVGEATHVLHMAAIAGVSVVVGNPATTLTTNLEGTQHVLSAARRYKDGIQRLIDFSTSEVYGPHVYQAKETGQTTQGSLYEPRWYYAVSKLASEFLTHAYYTEHGIPTVGIRPFNVYGKYQVGEGAVKNFVEAALKNRPLVVHGNGEQVRSWCYVDDMTRSILAALTTEAAVGQHFNVGNPRATTSTLELANAIIRITGSRSQVEFRKIAYPDVEVRVPDVTAMREVLGIEAEVGLEEGINRTIDWWVHRV